MGNYFFTLTTDLESPNHGKYPKGPSMYYVITKEGGGERGQKMAIFDYIQ